MSHLFREASLQGLAWSAHLLEHAGPLRRALVGAAERRIQGPLPDLRSLRHAPAVEQDKRAMKLALLHLVERALGEQRLSETSLRGLLKLLILDVLVRQGEAGPKQRFKALHGQNPPAFLVLSPGKACNLRCIGCYANSGPTHEKLEWSLLDRVVRDAHDGWGVRFFVLSGGEPFAYRSEGKDILDLAAAHPDCYFMSYTNGTLIDASVARELGRLGNLSPAISVEGMQRRTDARRGAGVFEKVLRAMSRLRSEGVLFGLSLTATRDNAEEVLSEEMVDFFFEEQGALYGWIFHYMPIGRAFSTDLMTTPEQRFRLWRRVWQVIRERRVFLADFWNSATVTNGCVAAGRAGGYLHLDWNGAVSPCVFMPYSPINIRDAYAAGKSLTDVWQEPFFAGIRAWQRDYGYRETGEPAGGFGNWLAPCLIRDHHAEFERLVAEHHPQPDDPDAAAALADPEYHARMRAYDRRFAELTDPEWAEHYLASPSGATGAPGRAPEWVPVELARRAGPTKH